jgi:hypothetical protein
VVDTDGYYELPYLPDCLECGCPLDEDGDCWVCRRDEYEAYLEEKGEAA